MGEIFKLPDHGRVVIASPGSHRKAAILADSEQLDWMLDRHCPYQRLYILDIDAILEPSLRSPRRRQRIQRRRVADPMPSEGSETIHGKQSGAAARAPAELDRSPANQAAE